MIKFFLGKYHLLFTENKFSKFLHYTINLISNMFYQTLITHYVLIPNNKTREQFNSY